MLDVWGEANAVGGEVADVGLGGVRVVAEILPVMQEFKEVEVSALALTAAPPAPPD